MIFGGFNAEGWLERVKPRWVNAVLYLEADEFVIVWPW